MEDKRLKLFKEDLFVKNINNQDYFYIRVQTPFFKKQYYVGKHTTSDKILEEYLYKIGFRIFVDTLYEILSKTKKKLRSKHISDKDFFELELLRVGFALFLNEVAPSDIEEYENRVFTKYVYGTTSVEGNTYTLRETDLTLNEGLTVQGKSKREFYEVENYKALKDYIDRKKRIKIDIPFIKRLHKFIMTNIDDDSAGEFRRVDVGIRGTEFTPAPAIFVEEGMEKLVHWFNENKLEIHPAELIACFHQKFEEIHPFKDGNGRVGRELMRIMLRLHGFPSIFIEPSNREEYLKALDLGNTDPHNSQLTKFIMECLLNVNKELIERANQKYQTLIRDTIPLSEHYTKKHIQKLIDKLKKIKMSKEYKA